MRVKINILFLIILFHNGCAPVQKKINLEEIEKERIISAADYFLSEEPVTITNFRSERSLGGPHDYYSEGDYWWPDPDNPKGPYIRKDGQTNPDNFTAHRKCLRNFSICTPALVAAYIITNDEKYADHALRHLLAWFVTPETLMNPNLLYAQAIKGRVSGRGIGIIDTIHLVDVAKAIQILADAGYLSESQEGKIKEWFRKYLNWMSTHPYGISERDHGNNHSTCWAVQVSAFASLTNDNEYLNYCRNFYKEALLPEQMAENGSFPKELKRTKPYAYSLFNLEAMTMLVQILSIEADDLWSFELDDGRGIRLGIEYMYPYVLEKSNWPLAPDIMYYDEWPVRQSFLLFGGLALNHPEYIHLWKTMDPDPQIEEVVRNYPFRQPILWIN